MLTGHQVRKHPRNQRKNRLFDCRLVNRYKHPVDKTDVFEDTLRKGKVIVSCYVAQDPQYLLLLKQVAIQLLDNELKNRTFDELAIFDFQVLKQFEDEHAV